MHRWLFTTAMMLTFLAIGRDAFDAWVDRTALPELIQDVSFEVHARDGGLLRVYPVENGRWRLATTPQDVDRTYIDLLIATEDKRFYAHSGVDLRALVRASVQAVRNRRIISGGSTLTMQTARLLENSGTGRWSGKLRQIRVALALERRLSKEKILSLYLTHAPFGSNLEGVRAASLAWLGKPAKRLTLAEAALLVGLPQAPETRRPDRFPDAATAARDHILSRLGVHTPEQAVPTRITPMPLQAPHVSDRARLAAGPNAHSARLTIDPHLQPLIADLARRAVQDLPDGASAAMLVADHQTGDILAYVGAAEYGETGRDGYVDMVKAQRSPGSTLKPLIYALAFDAGLAHPQTLMSDRPIAFGSYTPQNFDGMFRGDVTAERALQLSLNIPPVALTDALGPFRVTAALRRAGAQPVVPGGTPGLAVALGGLGLSLEELTQLYSGIARGGEPITLSWLQDKKPASGQRLVNASAAWQVQSILSGIQPPQGQPLGRIAFKTGTSYGHRDAWAIGWDGSHVIGIWLGRPDGTPVPGIFGGQVAAPILFEAFERVSPQRAPLSAPPPETLIQNNALLPKPLQRFRGSDAEKELKRPRVVFPPDGARFRHSGMDGLVIKLSGGTPPFTLLSNGTATQIGARRETFLARPDRGFSNLSVIDSQGASDDVQIYID